MAEQQQAAWPFFELAEQRRAAKAALADAINYGTGATFVQASGAVQHVPFRDLCHKCKNIDRCRSEGCIEDAACQRMDAELGTPHASRARARAFPAANCNVLALDLGTQCGWAVATRDGKFSSGSDRFDPKRCGGSGKRWLSFREFLTARAREAGSIQAVYYEDVKAHGPGVQAAHVYGGFLAVLELWCAANNIPLHGVGVGTIKKHATGKGNATKDQMIAASIKRGLKVADDNEADAVALLAYALEQEQ